jgi:hypothetical protein
MAFCMGLIVMSMYASWYSQVVVMHHFVVGLLATPGCAHPEN